VVAVSLALGTGLAPAIAGAWALGVAILLVLLVVAGRISAPGVDSANAVS
jgi:hypothetical protein